MILTELFHYTSASCAIEKILLDQQIKVGLIKYLNDPRESKDWALVPCSSAGLPTYSSSINPQYVNQKFSQLKQEEWKVVCFTTNSPRYKRHPGSYVDEGLLYGACRSRMWASYAENHRGVCLKFNGMKFEKQIKINTEGIDKNRKIFRGKVKYIDYGDTRNSVSIDYAKITNLNIKQELRNHLFKYYKQFFLSKSNEWKTEFEFRWLIHSECREAEFIPIKGIIEEVIVGVDFPSVNFPTLLELCNFLEIPIRGVIWRNGVPVISNNILKQ